MTPRQVHVAVIGAGIAGMQFTRDLTRRGISHTVYERGHEVGGTWRENTYPGLFIDVPVSLYQLSFARKYDWSHAFPRGTEIQEYLVRASHEHDLRRHIRFGVEVLAATWVADHWELELSDGTTEVADAVVSATGFLDKPSMPAIPGMDGFAGLSFHSSNWPAGLDVAGKRIGVVGTGSSGIQLTTSLSSMGSQVTQFVRSPQWVEVITNPPAPRWLKAVGRLLGARVPAVGRLVWKRLLGGPQLDPRLWRSIQWRIQPGPDRVAAQDALREDVLHIRDEDLRARMTPDFEPGCKRIPKSDRYFEAVQQPNVRVAVGAIDRVVPAGLVTADGELHELDVIVYATGYDSHAYMRPMKVTGLRGRTIDEAWADGPYAYRCVSVPDFPNFWVVNGPFAPVANISPTICVVDQSDYVCRLVEYGAEHGVATAPTAEAAERFVAAIDEAMPNTIWAGDCDSWYRAGDRVVLWPWDEATYHAMFVPLGLDDLELVPLPVAVP
ncbi:flavin-containing monooxygenase [Goekera deserti]|uniref:NAD(P)/FAD-dependent oxidoreductase n=1 Tax=Goekera deserti TaxID=2497753 RepID=A0A7K3WGC6_9ACTN|nr:NAD(P)/FAD-dependent oxidoreductase [Goekera deserti]NDI47184.1 NAD(P)-binding domain-containing protein [Goekera deserti]NEL55416.1 NAD(P)/FAD-dependent oxidoreductase [Goekera deserti]